MRLQNNVQAFRALSQYRKNTAGLIKSSGALGSGYAINRAGDNPAGLAISERMRSQLRGLEMASRNAQDGISIVQTAEGALQEVHSMLQRMNELAAQSATGTNQNIDREQLSREFNQLKNEIDDISRQTTFNNQRILDGSLSVEGAFRGALDAGIYVAPVEAEAVNSLTITQNDTGSDGPPATFAEGIFTLDFSKLSDGDKISISVGGQEVTSLVFDSLAFPLPEDVFNELVANTYPAFTAHYIGDEITFTSTNDGYLGDWTKEIEAGPNSPTYTLISFDETSFRVGDELTINGNTAVWGNPMTLPDFIAQFNLNPGDYEFSNDTLKLYAELTQDDIEKAFTSGPSTDKGGVNIQVGALKNEMLRTEIKAMSTRGLGLIDADVLTQSQAGMAITLTRDAIEKVSHQRSLLGAMQNRLELKTGNLDNAAENLQTAESKIRDVDIALEMTTYTKVGMLLQASTEMIRNSNDLPRHVINLLQ